MELKPCPFCGGRAILEDARTIWAVSCEDCDATVVGDRASEPDGTETEAFWDEIKQTAIDRWNRRAPAQAEELPPPK